MSINILFILFALIRFIVATSIESNYFEATAVESINKLRIQYQANYLRINRNLTQSAQGFANYLAMRDSGTLPGSDIDLSNCANYLYNYKEITNPAATPKCGENLAYVKAEDSEIDWACRPEYIIQLWESEKLYYDFTNPPSGYNASIELVKEFTQMVW